MIKKMLVKSMCALCCICLLQRTDVYAQADTLRLDIQTAERIFLEKNLQLLAAHYDVEADKALVQQARLWDNPTLVTDQNVYSNKQWFEHGTDAAGNPQGQVFVQVQQLIKTAGKRGKQVAMAKTTAEMSEWQFKDLMRNLRYQLRTGFYTIKQLQQNALLYQMEKEQLTLLLHAMQKELQAGNIAQKDLLRIQALDMNLQMEIIDNLKKLSDNQAEMKTLLQVKEDTFIQPQTEDKDVAILPQLNLLQLADTARKYNTDYMQQVLSQRYQQQNLRYQKALAVPDVTLGPEFDQNSNYTPNYYGIGISLPLPIADRNQGNIKSARWQVKKEDASMQQIDLKLQNDVQNAYKKLVYTTQFNSDENKEFHSKYYQLYNNIVQSYKQRQISMLDFIDYFNNFENIREQELQQILNVHLAKEELNYQVGTDVVN